MSITCPTTNSSSGQMKVIGSSELRLNSEALLWPDDVRSEKSTSAGDSETVSSGSDDETPLPPNVCKSKRPPSESSDSSFDKTHGYVANLDKDASYAWLLAALRCSRRASPASIPAALKLEATETQAPTFAFSPAAAPWRQPQRQVAVKSNSSTPLAAKVEAKNNSCKPLAEQQPPWRRPAATAPIQGRINSNSTARCTDKPDFKYQSLDYKGFNKQRCGNDPRAVAASPPGLGPAAAAVAAVPAGFTPPPGLEPPPGFARPAPELKLNAGQLFAELALTANKPPQGQNPQYFPPVAVEFNDRPYDRVAFRKEMVAIFSEIRQARTASLSGAVHRVRAWNVPKEEQPDVFSEMMSRAIEEMSGPGRRLCMAFVTGVAAGAPSAFDKAMCLKGVGVFFSEVYEDLQGEVPKLSTRVEREFLPAMRSVFTASELNVVLPVRLRVAA